MRHELSISDADESHCLGRYGGIQLQLWRTGVPLVAAQRAMEEAGRLPRDLEHGLLIVVEPGAGRRRERRAASSRSWAPGSPGASVARS